MSGCARTASSEVTVPAVNEHGVVADTGQRTVRLDVAYRGTGFRGFAANEGVRTVAGELGAALEHILGEAPVLAVAGRTDAGVHATGQVVSFRIGGEGLRRLSDWHGPQRRAARAQASGAADEAGQSNDSPVGLSRLPSVLSRRLNPEIAVTAATFADDSFDARHSATARAYEYRIRNDAHPDPRCADLEWHVAAPLDVGRMNAAAGHFVGEHDFASFCRRPKDRPDDSLARTVTHARWSVVAHLGDESSDADGVGGARSSHAQAPGRSLLFDIEANAFCHQMVRAVVGQCVAVGRGDRAAGDVPAVLAARSREAAAAIAPPHGLTLVAVRYADD